MIAKIPEVYGLLTDMFIVSSLLIGLRCDNTGYDCHMDALLQVMSPHPHPHPTLGVHFTIKA